jgi:hypothetical protein
MAKLTKRFLGALPGEIHPTAYEPGEDCPPELESAAEEAGAFEGTAPVKKPAPAAK